jgi:photosystem II stability/assembly factor-like uncharacterized protein
MRIPGLVGPLFLSAALVTAQSPVWQQVGQGLPRVSIEGALIADPAGGSTLYTIARNLLFKSTDGSDSWTALSGVTGVYSLLIDRNNSATLYAGTSHGVLKSTDGGSTWSGASAGLPQGWAAWAQVLATDPNDSSILYIQKSQDLFRSTDGGQSWNPLNARFYGSGSATPLPSRQIQTLAIDPAQPSTMYAGPGLWKTTDGGATWHVVSTTPGSYFNLVAFDAATSTLYASGDLGPSQDPASGPLFESTDDGATWVPIGRGFPNSATANFVFDPNHAGTIYASYVQLSWSGAPPVFGLVQSTDGGETWNAIPPPVPGSFILSLAVDANSTLYVTYRSEGAFKSGDGGATWSVVKATPAIVDVPAMAVDPGQAHVLYAAAGDNGVFRSSDGGAHWTQLSRFPSYTEFSGVPQIAGASYLAINPGNPQLLYAGSTCLLYKSADAGEHWQDVNHPYCGTSGVLAIDPQESNTLYLAQTDMVDGGSWVSKTVDGGTTWKDILSSTDYFIALAIDPITPATIYAGISRFAENGKGLLKTTDVTWSELDIRPGVNVVAIDPLHPNVVYAATITYAYLDPSEFMGLFKSTDAGATWSAINSGLETLLETGAPITALIFDPGNSDVLYAATAGNGVFRSVNGGLRWSPFNDGLDNFDARALAIDRGTPGLLYVSTSGGLFAIGLQERSQ